jgi:hypothetical protein
MIKHHVAKAKKVERRDDTFPTTLSNDVTRCLIMITEIMQFLQCRASGFRDQTLQVVAFHKTHSNEVKKCVHVPGLQRNVSLLSKMWDHILY